MYVPDNYDAWSRHQDQMERELAERQRCSECDEPITDDYCYLINGEYICQDCMNSYYMVETPVDED